MKTACKHWSRIMLLTLAIVPSMVWAGGGGGGSNPPSCSSGNTHNPSYAAAPAYDTDTYHTIIDHTQAGHVNVIVTNTQTKVGKQYPLTGSSPVNPWAAINGNLDNTGTPPTDERVLYKEVQIDNADLTNAALTTTTSNTQGTGTYVHRLGTYNGGSVTALEIAPAGSGNYETLLDTFSVNGQAFDLDRLRYVANKLWKKWKLDVAGNKGWYTKFGYQPTGTMSWEQYVSNINNGHPMFGIVRVMVPINASNDVVFDYSYPVDGNEFSGSPTWNGQLVSSVDEGGGYSAYRLRDNELNSYYGGGLHKTCAKVIEVYGMLLYDYVDATTYTPNDFETDQDYTDNASAGANNQILPRSSSKNVYIKVYESILVNPINDKLMGDGTTAGRDYRMDSLETARGHMINSSGATGTKTDMSAGNVSDSYVWEYWMRVAAGYQALPDGYSSSLSQQSSDIIADLKAEYNVTTETFTDTTGRRADFDNNVWPKLPTKDQYHAFFPNGYERGWMVAFDALDLDADEWNSLPKSSASSIDGDNVSVTFPGKASGITTYSEFTVPSETLDMDMYNGSIPYNLSTATVTDTDPNPNDIPNMFLRTWEDLPALSFAGGVLDMHAHANISGMLYTPDSAEMEAKRDKDAPFQYVSGAVLIGNGIYLQDGGTGDDSAIGLSFNDNTFDQLRSLPTMRIFKPQSIREVSAQ